MPTRADLEAAVPKCPRIKMRRMGRMGAVKEARCAGAMRYVEAGNLWRCPLCLQTVKGLLQAESHADLAAAA